MTRRLIGRESAGLLFVAVCALLCFLSVVFCLGCSSSSTGATIQQVPLSSNVSTTQSSTQTQGTSTHTTGPTATTTANSSRDETTRVTKPFSSPGTTVVGQYIRGQVIGSNDLPVSGASVSVVIDAADPLYKSSSGRLVGKVATGSDGRFEVAVTNLPQGTLVDISVTKQGYTSVMAYGAYKKAVVEVDFKDLGSNGGDRRMIVGDKMPPFPYEGLLPGTGSGS